MPDPQEGTIPTGNRGLDENPKAEGFIRVSLSLRVTLPYISSSSWAPSKGRPAWTSQECQVEF